MAGRKITDQTVLDSVTGLAGDGYCRVADLFRDLPAGSHRDRRRALQRTINQGMVIQRRGPDGSMHVGVTSEGWRVLRSETQGS